MTPALLHSIAKGGWSSFGRKFSFFFLITCTNCFQDVFFRERSFAQNSCWSSRVSTQVSSSNVARCTWWLRHSTSMWSRSSYINRVENVSQLSTFLNAEKQKIVGKVLKLPTWPHNVKSFETYVLLGDPSTIMLTSRELVCWNCSCN